MNAIPFDPFGPFDPDSVFWAQHQLPTGEATKHFLICGMTGGGKTTGIRLYLGSIAQRFRLAAPIPEQLVLFDAKCDAVPMLAGLGLPPEQENVWILNPYDARSAVWDLAEATQMPVMARSLATLLIPEQPNSTAPFFSDAARELVYAVILGLNKAAGVNWTLRDLLCALDSRENIIAVTARDERAKVMAARILGDKQHSSSVLSTLATRLGPFEQVAALWHTNRSGRKFSIDQFLARPGVLILGNDPVLRETIWPINAILLKALTNEILRRPDSLQPRHWFVLDEFRAMQRVDCIHDLINRGRSKGVALLLGIQSVPGLMEVYDEKGTNDILGQCACKTFLRVGDPITAEWIANYFNKVRHRETVVSESWGPGGWTRSFQSSVNDRPMFLPSFFLNLPFPGVGKPYVCVSDIPSLGHVFITRQPFDDLLSRCAPIDQVKTPGVVPRTDISEQKLLPWTDDEKRRFGGLPPSDEAPPSSDKPAPKPRGPNGLPPRHRLSY